MIEPLPNHEPAPATYLRLVDVSAEPDPFSAVEQPPSAAETLSSHLSWSARMTAALGHTFQQLRGATVLSEVGSGRNEAAATPDSTLGHNFALKKDRYGTIETLETQMRERLTPEDNSMLALWTRQLNSARELLALAEAELAEYQKLSEQRPASLPKDSLGGASFENKSRREVDLLHRIRTYKRRIPQLAERVVRFSNYYGVETKEAS